jgi:hypothetical protein
MQKGDLNKTNVQYFIEHCFMPAASQIPLCRRMLGSNSAQMRLPHWLSDAVTTRLDLIQICSNVLVCQRNILVVTKLD